MSPIRLAAAALLALCTAAPAFAADSGTFRVGTEGAYPPWNLKTADGGLDGFEMDLAKDLCARIGKGCQIDAQAWDGLIPQLQAKHFDGIMAGMSITDERKKTIAFSRPYATTPAILVAAKDSPLQKATDKAAMLKALEGKTVGVQTGTIHADFLTHDTKAEPRVYDTQDALNIDLAAGRIDAGIADASAFQPFLEGADGKDFKKFGVSLTGDDFPVFGEGIGIGLRKDDTELKASLDKAICDMEKDGTLKQLSLKWFHEDIVPACKD